MLCWAAALPMLAAADQPNIIFILADDLGYGDLSCFGQQNFQTPRLDQMAAEGLTFTDHYSGSTVCAPSRACLLTGLHTGHVYQRFNGPVEFRADPHDRTIAALLKQAGYRTAMIGKSGLSCNSDDGKLPNEKGFDHFFGYTSHSEAHRYFPKFLWRDGQRIDYPGNHGKTGRRYSGDLFLADTMRFLEENAEGPFFLHLSLQQPHADLSVPDKWKEPFRGKYQEHSYQDGHYRVVDNPKATFAGMVAYLDHSVGAVLDKLRELDIDDNTLVIFSSDNGAMSEGGWDRRHFNSSGPLRGGKRDMYEGGIRVPTIARWPGTVAAGRRTDHVSAFWDFVPTACELADVDVPTAIDGVSYAPTLTGRGTQRRHDYLYWEFYEQGAKQAVRMGPWKGIRLNVGANPDGPVEVYNLVDDLGESNNLAAERPEIAAKLAALMDEAHVDSEIVQFATGNRMLRKQPAGESAASQ